MMLEKHHLNAVAGDSHAVSVSKELRWMRILRSERWVVTMVHEWIVVGLAVAVEEVNSFDDFWRIFFGDDYAVKEYYSGHHHHLYHWNWAGWLLRLEHVHRSMMNEFSIGLERASIDGYDDGDADGDEK